MKTAFSFLLILSIVLSLNSIPVFGQYEAYTQISLPAGAKARFSKGQVNMFTYSPDNSRIAVATNFGTWIYDAHTREAIELLGAHQTRVIAVAYSPDGSTLATTVRSLDRFSRSLGSTLHLWDTSTNKLKATLTRHPYVINSITYSQDGTTIATGGMDNKVWLWDIRTGSNRLALSGHSSMINIVAYSQDGLTIASGSNDTTVRLWNASTSRCKAILAGHTGFITSIAFSPDDTTIATGSSDNTVRLWDATTGQHKTTFQEHSDGVTSVVYAPDGNTIVSTSMNGEVRFWDLETGKYHYYLKNEGGTPATTNAPIVYSPDGNTIASGRRSAIRFLGCYHW